MIMRVLRQTFTVRRCSLVLGIAAAGLASPAVSAAVATPCAPKSLTSCLIKTAPIHVGSQGFEFTLLFQQGIPTGYGGRYANQVSGIFFKHSGNAIENDKYSFSGGSGHHLRFKTGKKPLQFAQITGTFARSGGSISLIFKANGPVHKVTVPKGCSGQGGESRSGTLSGSYVLHTGDKLGGVKFTHKSLKATISTANYTCTKPSHGYEVQTTTGNKYVDVFKNSSNSVFEEIDVSSGGGTNGWAFANRYSVSGLPSSDYTVGSGLKSATVKGSGGTMSGTATYSSSHSGTHKTTGKLSGTTFGANLASIGQVNPFANPRFAEQTHS